MGRRRDRERGDRDRSSYRDRDAGRGGEREGSRDRYGSRPFIKKRGPQEEDICYNCGKTGHW